jgi:hypothetical protein
MYDTLPIELRMRALCLPVPQGRLPEEQGRPDPRTIGDPPEGATRLERLHWAIDGRERLTRRLRNKRTWGLLKQITEKELDACWLMYASLQARKQEREKVGMLSRRIKLARKLQYLLPYPLPDLEDIIALDEWLLNPEGDPPDPPASIPADSVVAAITSIRTTKFLQGRKFGKPLDQLSAFEVVAGWLIPAIFETHCGKPAGYSRNDADGRIRGEFVDFAEYVLLVLGIRKSDGAPYERRSIAEALTKCRRLRNQ